MKTMMKNLGMFVAVAVIASGAAACGKEDSKTTASAPATSAATAKAPDAYPLDTCVVTGEKLGEMGDVIKYNHNGREIRFCCPGCVAKFKADPEKYLKILDAAAAAKRK